MGNLNKAPWWALLQINDIGYPDLLFEVKFNFVSQHLPDDSDELAGTVPKGIIMSPAFSYLGIVIGLEGGVVFNNIVSCINKCISEDFGSMFRHPRLLSLVISGLICARTLNC